MKFVLIPTYIMVGSLMFLQTNLFLYSFNNHIVHIYGDGERTLIEER